MGLLNPVTTRRKRAKAGTFIDVSKSFIEAIQAFIDAKLIAAPACARLRRVLAINRHPAEPNEVDVQKYDCFRQ